MSNEKQKLEDQRKERRHYSLYLILKGWSVSKIADSFGVSKRTVRRDLELALRELLSKF